MNELSNPLFASLSRSGMETLARHVEEISYDDKTVIFEENDPSDFIYLIIEGKVQLSKHSTGRWVEIAVVQSGDYFGEVGILDGSMRSARAMSLGRGRALRIPGKPLMQILSHEPAQATLQFFKKSLNHLRVTNERFVAEVLHKEKIHFIGEMASTIIHDFKNPITAIQLTAKLISNKHRDSITQQRCNMIVQQSQRMVIMVQELLDYAGGNLSLKKEVRTMASLFERFETLNRDFWNHSNVKVFVQSIQARVEMDLDRMLRVLQNLTMNAIEAMETKRKGQMSILAVEDGDWVEICVRDTGPGIPEKIRETIFEPFVTYGKRNGTGLGMAIARMLVEAHQGRISFETETGKGTSFYIRLPRVKEGDQIH